MGDSPGAATDHSGAASGDGVLWRLGARGWATVGLVFALTGFIFADAAAGLLFKWSTYREYSYGFLVPVVALYLGWARSDTFATLPTRGSWAGLALIAAGLGLAAAGELAAIDELVEYAFVVVLGALALAWFGPRATAALAVPIGFLVFMVPLPQFAYNQLSGDLQLVSSALGVAVIRLLGISVFLEGNVIDLGAYQLQVAEACSGLRYLFPLSAFSFLCAVLFRAPLWQRAAILVSSVPVTIMMNGFRIAVIGALVEHFGSRMAEGFLHAFEGWLVFMVCAALLLAEVWLLSHFQRRPRPFREAFGLDVPRPAPAGARRGIRPLPAPLLGCVILLTVTTAGLAVTGEREEARLARDEFARFPATLGSWQGVQDRMSPVIAESLELTDYLLADYRAGGAPVNLYVAYYATQRKTGSAHSPRSCIPGGGWRIEHLSRREIATDGPPFAVNRVEIQRGAERALVYYWFEQRGRVLTDEYAVKGYLLWDALARNRTDGALVRIVTPVAPGAVWSAADGRLVEFASLVRDALVPFVPD